MLMFILSLPLLKGAWSRDNSRASPLAVRWAKTQNRNRSARIRFYGLTRVLGYGYVI
jgi:hypothetical protein